MVLLLLEVNGKCLMFGQCFTDPSVGKVLNCYTPNKPAESSANWDPIVKSNLVSVCAELFQENNGCCPMSSRITFPNVWFFSDAELCCDQKQAEALYLNIGQLDVFKRCRSCRHNLRRLFCQFACSPNQVDFLTTNKINVTDDGHEYVEAVDFNVSEEFASSTYDSCKEVSMPQTGQTLMNAVACGKYSYHCNPQRYFSWFVV